MGKKTDFAVYKNRDDAKWHAAYNCGECGQPVIGYGNDEKGLFVGQCGNGHRSTLMAS